MSTWEERMSIRAKARMAAEAERERARQEGEWQAEQVRIEKERQPLLEAGPPNGCRECYVLVSDWFAPGHIWIHAGHSAKPGPQPPPPPGAPWLYGDADESHWCWHECHGANGPVYCGPVAIA